MPNCGLPLLVIVTGRPGSGKTTLARALAQLVRCPMIGRDELKEGLILTLGATSMTHPEITARVYETFFKTIDVLLRDGISLVAEAAFQHKVWTPKLKPLMKVADVRIVVCDVPAGLAFKRRVERERLDPVRLDYHPHLPAGEEYDPPALRVPTLVVDTTREVDLAAVMAFLQD